MDKPRRLFCFVDETGQDTKGQLFIVVAIMTVELNKVAGRLEAAEASSGKGKVKWHRTRKNKAIYLKSALDAMTPIKVYYQIFTGSELSYELATVQATANAIDAYCANESIKDYKATIVIDGLRRSLQNRIGKLLCGLGIRTKSVRGERDEASPIIRLADAVAGFVRESYEGDPQLVAIKQQFERRGAIRRLP